MIDAESMNEVKGFWQNYTRKSLAILQEHGVIKMSYLDEKQAEIARREGMIEVLTPLRRMVNTQSEDDGIWFEAKHITEAYLQEQLRVLHRAIETPFAGEDDEY